MKLSQMSDIKRSMIRGFIVFFIVIGILGYILLNTVYIEPFKELEREDALQTVESVRNEIDYRLNEVLISAADWGVWDETYLYTQGFNDNYIEFNLVDENFDSLDFDISIITNDSGNILYGKQIDIETNELKTINQSTSEMLKASGILENKDIETYFNDILLVDGSPYLIGAYPIIRTSGRGPVKGQFIFGKILDDNMMDEMSDKLNLKVSFELLTKSDFDQLSELSEEGIEILSKNENYILGNYYITGIFEEYYTKISIEIPRNVMAIGLKSRKNIILIVPLIFILTLLVLWIFLDKQILSRIVNLYKQVLAIKNENSISTRLDVDDKADEISELSQGINGMLDSLEGLHNIVSEANNVLEEKVLERTKELEITNHRLEVEIIERQKIQEEITYLAYHDVLTGLPNRLLLSDRLNQGILQANRNEALISIMFIDIDEFKIINDTLGHDQGDELLKQFSTRLSNIVRKNDSACRIGGDEFVLYFNGYKNEEALDIIACKVMNIFKKPFFLRGQEYFITGSMGIAQYPIDGENVETLMKNADMAMYKAKSLGKNQYIKCSENLKDSVLETMSLTNSLYSAIERNQMILHYQPQVNGLTGEIIGVEALLRWKHPEHGFISPFKFIPLAEKTRLILPIGYWVLKNACEQCKAWQEKGFKPIRMAVNFSVHQLNYPGIIEQIKEILEETSLEAKYLEIEITESTAMDDNCKIKETLGKIKALGITLSIDDFGKEYSSLNRLKELPIDRVKIDMSFVQGIGISDKDETITKAVILLAVNLGLKTIAEGVETTEQMEFLNQRMCDELQGYYLYKPMPAAELEKLLVTNYSVK